MAPSQAFPRSARLTQGSDYQSVFADAQRYADRYFTVLTGCAKANRPRLGLAISKRIAPRAVDRNRLKRLIREAFRHHQGDLPMIDIVVMARPIACQAENATLFASLDRLWERILRQCDLF